MVSVEGRVIGTAVIPKEIKLDSTDYTNPYVKIEQKAFTASNAVHGERFDEVMVCDHMLTDEELSLLIK